MHHSRRCAAFLLFCRVRLRVPHLCCRATIVWHSGWHSFSRRNYTQCCHVLQPFLRLRGPDTLVLGFLSVGLRLSLNLVALLACAIRIPLLDMRTQRFTLRLSHVNANVALGVAVTYCCPKSPVFRPCAEALLNLRRPSQLETVHRFIVKCIARYGFEASNIFTTDAQIKIQVRSQCCRIIVFCSACLRCVRLSHIYYVC